MYTALWIFTNWTHPCNQHPAQCPPYQKPSQAPLQALLPLIFFFFFNRKIKPSICEQIMYILTITQSCLELENQISPLSPHLSKQSPLHKLCNSSIMQMLPASGKYILCFYWNCQCKIHSHANTFPFSLEAAVHLGVTQAGRPGHSLKHQRKVVEIP